MDRKRAIREYKEGRRPMGIFRVRNTVSGRWLVGATVDLPAALNRQRATLRLGGHPDRDLQGDWNELGPDAFVFEVLDTLEAAEGPEYDPAEDLGVLEQLWLERCAAAGGVPYRYRQRRIR